MDIAKVIIGEEIKSKVPTFSLGFLAIKIGEIDVDKIESHLKEIENEIKANMDNDKIKARPMIASTRSSYKTFGKDPNRYRPAAEQLARRVLSHGEIYRVSPIVDLGNIISLMSGYSIGVIDASKVSGDVKMGLGQKDEVFNGIGRGAINVENLPIYRDEIGAFATPTSDEERTKILSSSKFLYIFINDFSTLDDTYLQSYIDITINLFSSYCGATNIFSRIIK